MAEIHFVHDSISSVHASVFVRVAKNLIPAALCNISATLLNGFRAIVRRVSFVSIVRIITWNLRGVWLLSINAKHIRPLLLCKIDKTLQPLPRYFMDAGFSAEYNLSLNDKLNAALNSKVFSES